MALRTRLAGPDDPSVASLERANRGVLSGRRKAGKSTHPFYWAAFVAAGDWR